MLLKPSPALTTYGTESLTTRRQASGISAAYLPLIERMRGLRESRPDPVALAFASIDHGAGTTYVTDRLSTDLRLYTGERVATCSAVELWESSVSPLLPVPADESGMATAAARPSRADTIDLLRQHFGYIIVDCPPLRHSPDAMVLAKRMDGLCLVIEAGRTTRSEVQSYLSPIASSGTRVFGLVLNKRKYPVPNFIYRML
jgi:hypothetical protein